MLTDAHAHLTAPGELSYRAHTRTLFCGTDPETAAQALSLRAENRLACCGLHPWHADRWSVEALLPFIGQGVALGEIGLDSVWCGVAMEVQRRAFTAQLELARQLGLPIILHTKGMEAEIAQTIRRTPMPKMVHWYSCASHLDDYLDQDCWFTVGPDYATNPAVQAVLKRVPLDRILTETDGLDAVAWALNRPVRADEIETVLRGELQAIAAVHGITPAEAEGRVEENLARFVGR